MSQSKLPGTIYLWEWTCHQSSLSPFCIMLRTLETQSQWGVAWYIISESVLAFRIFFLVLLQMNWVPFSSMHTYPLAEKTYIFARSLSFHPPLFGFKVSFPCAYFEVTWQIYRLYIIDSGLFENLLCILRFKETLVCENSKLSAPLLIWGKLAPSGSTLNYSSGWLLSAYITVREDRYFNLILLCKHPSNTQTSVCKNPRRPLSSLENA